MKTIAAFAAMLCALLWSALPAAAQAPTGLENTHRFAYVRDGSVWKTCVDVFTIQKATAKCWLNAGRLTEDGRFVKIDPTKVTDGEIILIGIPTPVLKAQANDATPAAPAAGIEEPNTTVKKGETPDTAAQAAGNLALESTKPQSETPASPQAPAAFDPIVRTPEQISPETSQSLGVAETTVVSSEPVPFFVQALIAIFFIAFVGSMVLTVHDHSPSGKGKIDVAAIRAKNRKELGLPPVPSQAKTPAPRHSFPPKEFHDKWRRPKPAPQATAAPSKDSSGRKLRRPKPAFSKLALPKLRFSKLGSKKPVESPSQRAARLAEANRPLQDFDAPPQKPVIVPVASHDWMTRSNAAKGRAVTAPEPVSTDVKPQPRLARDIPVLEQKKPALIETNSEPAKAPDSPYGIVSRTLTVKGRFLRSKTDTKITLSFRKSALAGRNIEWFNPADKDWEAYVPNSTGRRILRELALYSALGLEFDVAELLRFQGEPSQLVLEGKFPSSDELHKEITGTARVVELRAV